MSQKGSPEEWEHELQALQERARARHNEEILIGRSMFSYIYFQTRASKYKPLLKTDMPYCDRKNVMRSNNIA